MIRLSCGGIDYLSGVCIILSEMALHGSKEKTDMTPVGSGRVGSGRFGSVRFGSVRFGSVRFGSIRFGSGQEM